MEWLRAIIRFGRWCLVLRGRRLDFTTPFLSFAHSNKLSVYVQFLSSKLCCIVHATPAHFGIQTDVLPSLAFSFYLLHSFLESTLDVELVTMHFAIDSDLGAELLAYALVVCFAPV